MSPIKTIKKHKKEIKVTCRGTYPNFSVKPSATRKLIRLDNAKLYLTFFNSVIVVLKWNKSSP